jgi:hypothetical protein
MFIEETPHPFQFRSKKKERNVTRAVLQDIFRSFFFERNCRRGCVAVL